jgi:hypothetical protein
VSGIRITRFGIGRTVLAIRDTRVRLFVLVYCQARATPNDRLRPNAATTVDYRVGQARMRNGTLKFSPSPGRPPGVGVNREQLQDSAPTCFPDSM